MLPSGGLKGEGPGIDSRFRALLHFHPEGQAGAIAVAMAAAWAYRWRETHPPVEEALWSTGAGMGDRDTTCAIVGGIVALSAGREPIPRAWLSAREPLDVT